MPRKDLYTVPDTKAAHRLAKFARLALEAARERAPDQGEHAGRLFREIYGPKAPRRLLEGSESDEPR